MRGPLYSTAMIWLYRSLFDYKVHTELTVNKFAVEHFRNVAKHLIVEIINFKDRAMVTRQRPMSWLQWPYTVAILIRNLQPCRHYVACRTLSATSSIQSFTHINKNFKYLQMVFNILTIVLYAFFEEIISDLFYL